MHTVGFLNSSVEEVGRNTGEDAFSEIFTYDLVHEHARNIRLQPKPQAAEYVQAMSNSVRFWRSVAGSRISLALN